MKTFSVPLTRRSVLAGTAGAAFAGAMPKLAAAQGGPDWKKFKGSKIEVNLVKSPRGELLQRNLKQFQELTGIEVGLEQIPEQQQRQKVVVELASGQPSFDVVHLSYHVQKRQFEKGKWLADLKPFLNDASVTDPALKLDDFSAAGLSYAQDEAGQLLSLPWSVDYWIIYWNKELFQKKGVAYPTTFEELVKAAAALTDPKEGTFGFTARGLKNANVPVWSSFMMGYGGEPLQSDSQAAIDGAKLYQELLSKYSPPGTIGFNWNECQSAFLQGRVAMWLDGVGFAPPLEDPTKSRVVGKVGYGVMPKGPVQQASATFGDGIGVTAASKNKGAAYLFCQWAVSQKLQAELLQTGSGVPFRKSVIDDPEVRKGVKLPAAWIDAVSDSAKISKLGLPVVIPVTEFRDIIGIALTNTLSGADPAAELKRATAEFRPILQKSEQS